MANFNFFMESLMQYKYLQNAMITGILVGLICGLIGCFIILKGMALMGDAISHAVLPGVAIAYLLGFNFFIGAIISGVLTAIGIGYIYQNSKIKYDSAIGIMFTAAFALGIILITSRRGTGIDLWHILFGNILAVSNNDLIMVMVISIIVLICVFLFYRYLLLSIFDSIMATTVGIPTKLIHYLLMLMLALVTVASLKTVGIILVVAMLITPGCTAYLLTNRFSVMLALSSIFGIISVIIGIYFSFIYDVATGASIVLVASTIFLLCFMFAPKQGLLIKRKIIRKEG